MTDRVLITAGDGRDALSLEYRPDTLDEAVIREVFVGDSYQLRHDPIRAAVRDGLIIDAGANIGCFSAACLALGAAFVYAIEPEPANRALLERNLAPWGDRVTIVPALLERPNHRGTARIVGTSGDARLDWSADADGPEVPILDFDLALAGALSLRPTDPTVDLLKIDIEGSEYRWLSTATRDQMRRIDRIAMEFHGTTPDTEYDWDPYGWLHRKLAETHAVSCFGEAEVGGMLYAHPYQDPRA